MELTIIIAAILLVITVIAFMGRKFAHSQPKNGIAPQAVALSSVDTEQARTDSMNLFGSSDTDKEEIKEEQKEILLEGEMGAEDVVEYLKEQGYKPHDFSDLQLDILENTKILGKYEDWSYSEMFSLENGKVMVFFPKVVVPQHRRITHYTEYNLMFWAKIDNYAGRYFCWEKASGEEFHDRIRTDLDIKLLNYDSITLQKGGDRKIIKKILDKFDNENGLEIEIEDDDLFVKTMTPPNLKDFKRIEKVLHNL